MSAALKLEFAPFSTPAKGVLIVFCEEGLKFGSATRKVLHPTGDLVTRAAAAERFKGKNASTLDLVAPAGLDVWRLVVVGAGKARDLKPEDFVKLGGVAMGKVPAAATIAVIVADLPGGGVKPERAADLARRRPSPRARRWQAGWCWPATSSTNRRTCCFRKNSPAARAS